MSSATPVNLGRSLEESTADVLWRQWNAVASLPSVPGKPPACGVVDPEALVLLSLSLRDYERRLWDVLTWWAETGSRLLSVQRFKKLMAEYPQEVQVRAGEFAGYAERHGGDGRWRTIRQRGDEPPSSPETRGGKQFGEDPALIEPAALLLRLRAGFGVGAKADLLGFLLGKDGAWCSIREIASATYYTPRALSTVADDMASARLVHATRSRPVEYRIEPQRWAQLLGLERLPIWRHWQPLYAFTARTLTWRKAAESRTASAYVLSTEARDLVLDHWPAFSQNAIVVPRPEDFPGETYLEAFADTLDKAAQWMVTNV